MDVTLPDALLAELRATCEATYPAEACGLLLGRASDGAVRVERLVAALNLDPRPDRFRVDPKDFAKADSVARDAGLEIVGTYHSHPDRAERPSAADLAAAQPGWSHVIVSVRGNGRTGTAFGATSWRVVEDQIGRRLVEERLRGAPPPAAT